MNLFFFIAGGVYILDVVSKIAVRKYLPYGAEISILSFFSLVHVENTGIAFGLFQGKNQLFLILSILMIGVITWLAWTLRNGKKIDLIALGLVLGGALGNITDRWMLGRVTDFLDFFIGHHHWPAFNVADSAICVGAGLMLIGGLLKKKIENRE